MRKSGYLFLFVSLLAPTFCLGQKTKLVDGKLSGILPVDPQGQVCYQNVFRIDTLSKQQLVKRAKQWFEATYSLSNGDHLHSDDSTGEISGRGRFSIGETRLGISHSYVVKYTLTFTARTSSYGLTISDSLLDGPHTSTPLERIPMQVRTFGFGCMNKWMSGQMIW